MRNFYKIVLLVCFCFTAKELFAIKTIVDTLPPVTTITNTCENFNIRVTELRNGIKDSNGYQLDRGVKAPPNLITHNNRTFNFSEIELGSDFQQGKTNYDFSFKLNVVNKYLPANAVFLVYDDSENQNIKYDSIKYLPELIEFIPNIVAFGPVNINTNKPLKCKLKNITNFPFKIKSIKLKYGINFTITESLNDYLLEDSTGEEIEITYTPKSVTSASQADIDSVIIETSCLRFAYPITGTGVEPQIYVEDVDFGAVEVGSKICKNDTYNSEFGKGLAIQNIGNGFLQLNGYKLVDNTNSFTFTDDKKVNLNNHTILPGVKIAINNLCFEPKSKGEFNAFMLIKSNSNKVDSIAYLKAYAYMPGIYLTSYNFYGVRVETSSSNYISVKNSYSQPMELLSLSIKDGNDFRIKFEDINSIPSKNNPIIIYPQNDQSANLKEFLIPIEYTPKSEYSHKATIFAEFKNKDGYIDTVQNYIYGYGWAPKIYTTNYTFNPRILVNQTHPDTGYVSIKSISDTRDLVIYNFKILDNSISSPKDFIILKSLIDSIVLSKNQELRIPVLFRPLSSGVKTLHIQIISNAFNEKNVKSIIDTTIIELTGEAFNRIVTAKQFTLDSVLNCNTITSKINIMNVSDKVTAKINRLEFISGDVNSFVLLHDFNKFPVTLMPGQDTYLDVQFNPIGLNQFSYQATAKIYSDVDTCLALFTAKTYRQTVHVFLDSMIDVFPGIVTEKSEFNNKTINFKIDGKDLGNLNINRLALDFVYSSKALKFENKVQFTPEFQTWKLLSYHEERIEGYQTKLHLEMEGFDPIYQYSEIFSPVFSVLLGDSNSFSVSIISASFGNSDRCILPKYSAGKINLSYCGIEIRNILSSGISYALNCINSDFGIGNNLQIIYSLGLSSDMKLDLYDNFGQNIINFDNGFKKPGNYVINQDISELSSGVYFIVLKSGPYYKTEKIIIRK